MKVLLVSSGSIPKTLLDQFTDLLLQNILDLFLLRPIVLQFFLVRIVFIFLICFKSFNIIVTELQFIILFFKAKIVCLYI